MTRAVAEPPSATKVREGSFWRHQRGPSRQKQGLEGGQWASQGRRSGPRPRPRPRPAVRSLQEVGLRLSSAGGRRRLQTLRDAAGGPAGVGRAGLGRAPVGGLPRAPPSPPRPPQHVPRLPCPRASRQLLRPRRASGGAAGRGPPPRSLDCGALVGL